MNTRHNKSSIMLLEIMINICFFAVLIAVCMQLLVHALKTSSNSTDLNHAISLVQSVAEVYQSSDGDEAIVKDSFSDGETLTDVDTLFIYYDSDYKQCAKDEAKYYIVVEYDRELSLKTAGISFYRINGDEEVYSINASVHEKHVRGGDINGD